MTLLALIAAVLMSAPAGASPNSGLKRYVVEFKSGTPQAVRDRVKNSLGGREVVTFRSNGTSNDEFEATVVESRPGFRGGIFSVDPESADPSALAHETGVLIEEDYRVKWIEAAPVSFQATAFPSLGDIMRQLPKLVRGGRPPERQAARDLPWGIKAVKAPAAWRFTEGQGVKVAVIDTGIKSNHVDLRDQVYGGYNAIENTERPGSYEDDNGHGTHVAGIIAARRDGRGVVGVAPKAMLYSVKVMDKDGSGNLSDIIKGIIWCANNNIQVANMSLGAPTESEILHRAVKYAKSRSVVIVAAAGNSCGSGGSCAVGYPGAYPEAIGVAAANSDNQISEFSSRGPEVKFIAPGEDIKSTWINGDWVSLSGTSMAAPHVTGLAALAVSMGKRGLGGPDGVLQALTSASSSIGLAATEEGRGMIDAEKLVQ